MSDQPLFSKTFAAAVAPTSLEPVSSLRSISRYKGMPSISFSKEEVARYSLPYKYTLVGSFWHGRPSMKQLAACMERIGFKTTPKLRLLDDQHIILTFQQPEDYHRCFLRRSWSVNGYIMRITKWTPDFDPKIDKPIVPIWVSIRGVPLYLQNKSALWEIAHMIGLPLKMDSATFNGVRPSVVRLCIEVDISKPLPTRLHIQGGDNEIYPSVEYENVPLFCTVCRILGHDDKSCKQLSQEGQEVQPPVPTQNPTKPREKAKRWTPKKINPKQPMSIAEDTDDDIAPETNHPDADCHEDEVHDTVENIETNAELKTLSEKQDLSKTGVSMEQVLEENDDVLDATRSDSELLSHAIEPSSMQPPQNPLPGSLPLDQQLARSIHEGCDPQADASFAKKQQINYCKSWRTLTQPQGDVVPSRKWRLRMHIPQTG